MKFVSGSHGCWKKIHVQKFITWSPQSHVGQLLCVAYEEGAYKRKRGIQFDKNVAEKVNKIRLQNLAVQEWRERQEEVKETSKAIEASCKQGVKADKGKTPEVDKGKKPEVEARRADKGKKPEVEAGRAEKGKLMPVGNAVGYEKVRSRHEKVEHEKVAKKHEKVKSKPAAGSKYLKKAVCVDSEDL
jgi:hypothetical protein